MRARTRVSTALAVALLVAACGGDDDDTTSSTPTVPGPLAELAAERHETPVTVDPEDRCDLGFNTARFNETGPLVERLSEHSHAMQAGEVDFTARAWAEVFVDPALGAGTPEQVAQAVEGNADMRKIILGGVIADTLDPDSWVPLTDEEDCEQLADELSRARAAAARYPTAADALAAGYEEGSVYVPGKGAHFSSRERIGDGFDPDEPDMLMYDSQAPTAKLMGMSYFVISPDGVADDEGFTGASDRWHSHDTNCTDDNGVAIAPTECDAGRGNLQTGMNGWMLHAWVVPGCESDWGVFSGTNPALKVLPPGVSSLESGCNTGKTLADPLVLDESGDGPRVG